ncbi:hypothetical protein [Candidatus Magnetominusculus xianensis]|uniref:Transposase n=1 Tax=Candidatus Magnetominusculus xianensis TaxID=1748249 RepID=A0ABR5SEX8_9BACT|nr:hypothetical protein [Candidatus Magnetominusculus xianensis]KWT85297.1 transposase [Candidatus Magnetominusculus xianensis]MBF0404808.1 hypothetical protein [Nitrospirota bacterium]
MLGLHKPILTASTASRVSFYFFTGHYWRQALRAGLSRRERREKQRRFRKERKRTTPSEAVIFRYLSKFHDKEQEKLRVGRTAFIPKVTENLKALMSINTGLIGFEVIKPCEETATLDMDATLSETSKKEALYSYEGREGISAVKHILA